MGQIVFPFSAKTKHIKGRIISAAFISWDNDLALCKNEKKRTCRVPQLVNRYERGETGIDTSIYDMPACACYANPVYFPRLPGCHFRNWWGILNY